MEKKIRRQVNFRLTEDEWQKVEEKIKKSNLPMSVSAYAKDQTLYGKIFTSGIESNDVKIITTSLARIGNNVNQIAKLFNAGKLPSEIPVEKILVEIKFMEHELGKLFQIEKFAENTKLKLKNKLSLQICKRLKNMGIGESIGSRLLLTIYPYRNEITDDGLKKILMGQNINLSLQRAREIFRKITEIKLELELEEK